MSSNLKTILKRKVNDQFTFLPHISTEVGQDLVGVEIEVETKSPNSEFHHMDYDEEFSVGKRWVVKADGSLKVNGLEFVSEPTPPDQLEELLTNLDEEYLKFANTGLWSNVNDSVRASTHIHLNVRNMTMLDVFKFMCTYYILENLLTKYCGEGREGNLFCLRFSDNDLTSNALNSLAMGTPFNYLFSDNLRYGGLNFQSLPKFGTLEFRSLKTTSDPNKIIEWVTLLYKVRDYSSKLNKLSDIPYFISGKGLKEWAYEVLGKEFVDEYYYQGFNMEAIENMRRLQIFMHEIGG